MSNKEASVEAKIPEKDIVEDRIYVIPLRDAWSSPRKRRTPRAIRILKEFITRHMKADSVKIDNSLNEAIWSKGIEKPPRKIRVRAIKDREGVVTLLLAEGK
ncbi:50S ribosomal protein L31e [Candidatus Bathyarchaeota archaeon]|nr:50S ribosomal protein L31e [Candidatus Bathyarchaeota archaeon]